MQCNIGKTERVIRVIAGLGIVSLAFVGPASPWASPASAICRVDDGVPDQVDRTGALGNAVVPQIPELIGRAIMQAEGMMPDPCG